MKIFKRIQTYKKLSGHIRTKKTTINTSLGKIDKQLDIAKDGVVNLQKGKWKISKSKHNKKQE